MVDVIVAGTGPAATVAALVLARAGTRVLIVGRDTARRDGRGVVLLTAAAESALERLGLTAPEAIGRRLAGWCLGLPHAPMRRELDDNRRGPIVLPRAALHHWLRQTAARAGARFEPGWHVRAPLIDSATGCVRGVVIRRRHSLEAVRMPAHLVVEADGPRSALARRLGLVVPSTRRRWVCDASVVGIAGMSDRVEIHLTSRSYCRVTPLGKDVIDIRGVLAQGKARGPVDLAALLSRHEHLASRVAGMRVVGGPWITRLEDVEVRTAEVPGLLVAGDGRDDSLAVDDLAVAVADGHRVAAVALEILESRDGPGAIVQPAPVLDAQSEARQRAGRRLDWMLRHGWSVHAAGVGSRIMPRLATRLLLHEAFT